jgi:sulfate adenylyltransferase
MRRPGELPVDVAALAFVEAPPTVEGIAALGTSPVALAPLVGHGRRGVLGRDALVRACLAVLPDLPPGSVVVPVPVPAGSDDLLSVVAEAYGLPVVDVSFGTTYAPAVVRELERVQSGRGAVVLLTGLSGSGKSTIARALRDRIVEEGRDVTLLDGDVVRRLLSAGLGFSAEDRDLNVRRIGYVAAEVARHGGLAVAAPLAPYARSRAAVRAMVEDAGAAYVLVHVSTSLEVCEARDRKGLYAKARRGEIDSFTGVSDPYERPADADVTIDTSEVPVTAAVDTVMSALRDRGLLKPT